MKTLTLARWLVGVSILAVVAVLAWPHGLSDAAGGFSFDTHVNYRVSDDSTTQVTQNYSVINQTDRQFLTRISLTTPVASVSGLEAHYSDGTKIPVTVTAASTNRSGLTYHYQTVTLNFPRQIVGVGRSWAFTLTYSATGLVEAHGGAHTVYVPQIASDAVQDNYTARVDVPANFGTPHFTGVKTKVVVTSGGRQYFDFDKSVVTAKALALQFGDQTTYRVNFNFPLANDSSLSRTETVTLPPTLNNQKVQIQSLDPAPLNTKVDGDGNILASYRLSPHQHLTIKTEVIGQVNYLEYNLAASGRRSDIPASLARQYTGATQYWQTTGRVAQTAASLTKPNAPVIDNVRAIYSYVVDHLSYNPDKIKFNVRQGSAAALANPTNVVCLEYSDLMIAMLRSQGIPARMPVGYGYSGSLKASAKVVDSLHSWVEAYVPGIGWMTLDPTWGEKFDLFGQSDLDHFAFAVWGSKDQLPAPVEVSGQDAGYQYEQTTLDYIKTATELRATPAKLSLTKHIILPLVSIDEVKIEAPNGSVTANSKVLVDGQTITVGDLGPSEHLSLWHWQLSAAWQRATVAELIQASGGQNLVLAKATTKLEYGGLVVVLILVGVGVIWLGIVKSRAHHRQLLQDHHE